MKSHSYTLSSYYKHDDIIDTMSINYRSGFINERLQEFSDYWLEQINNVITGKIKPFDEDARDSEYWNDLREALCINPNDDNNQPVIDYQHKTTIGTRIDVYSRKLKFLAEQKKAVFDTDENKWSTTIDTQTAHDGITPLEQAVGYVNNLKTNDVVPLHVAVCNYNMIRIYDTDTAKRIIAGKSNKNESFLSEFTIDEFAQHEDDLRMLFNIETVNYGADDARILETSKQAASKVRALKKILTDAYNHDDKYVLSYDNNTGKHKYDYSDDLARLVTILVFAFYADNAELFSQYNLIIGRTGSGKPGFISDGTNDELDSHVNLRNKIKQIITALTEPDYMNDGSLNLYKIDNLDDDIHGYKFKYIGQIFGKSNNRNIYIPHNLSNDVYKILLDLAAVNSRNFHWRDVDAVMFGSMMEGMFSHDDKISNGIYWTPRKFIHMVIDPVFIREKTLELNRILKTINEQNDSMIDNVYMLNKYIDSLADYRIMDPACGSGNFLTEIYLTMRRLENKALKAIVDLHGAEYYQSHDLPDVRVKPSQFYGIEINDYACIVAEMAMAIAETRALRELKQLVPLYQRNHPFFPITGGCTIVNHNALTEIADKSDDNHSSNDVNVNENDNNNAHSNMNMKKKVPFDWNIVMPLGQKNEHSDGYIYDCKYLVIGNPPFIGNKKMNTSMKEDMVAIYNAKPKTAPQVDYCSGWYIQAANYLKNTNHGEFSFVSTANICKGEQPAHWFDKLKNNGWFIQTAWRQFQWSNDSHDAAPAVIIVHFSKDDNNRNANKYIITDKSLTDTNDYNDVNDYEYNNVRMINRYLDDNEDVLIKYSKNVISLLHLVKMGSRPIAKDLIINDTDNDYDALMNDKIAKPFIRKYIGAEELKNGYYRHCIWITSENDYKMALQSPVLKARFQEIHNSRASSQRKATNKLKDYEFGENRQQLLGKHQLVIPFVNNKNSPYMLCDYVSTDVIVSNLCFTCLDETGLNFSIIETKNFMKWQSYLGGSLFGGSTNFANTLTWNNYPLPSLTDDMRDAIINAGRNILAVRDTLTDDKTGRKLTLNEMYKNMPPALRAAHSRLDLLVDSVIHDYATGADGSFNELLEIRVSAFNDGLQDDVNNHAQSEGEAVSEAVNRVSEPVLIKDVNTDAFIDLYGKDAVYSDDDRIHDLLAAYKKMTEK